MTADSRSRARYPTVAPEAVRALRGVEEYVRGCGLEHSLLELVKLRASYLNGCAYCVDMHANDARAAGETEQRLYAVPVWRETPFFSPRERIGLEWCESVTAIGNAGVPDDLYLRASEHFTEVELVNLTMAVITINSWNRLAVTFRTKPGSYQPKGAPAQ
jgi:alkylhydroperoxidase AhpD family core domain